MDLKEIEKYLDKCSFLTKVFYDGATSYEVYSKTFYPDDLDMPYENTARAIILTNYGIYCRNLRIMNGLIYARESVPVNNITELNDFLNEIKIVITEHNRLYKQFMENRKIDKLNEDF